MTYAKDTGVPVERSRAEIEMILARYGATCFGYMTEPECATIAFEINNRRVRFEVRIPTVASFKKYQRKNSYGRLIPCVRTDLQAIDAQKQACRQRWRALALVVKAKLEAVECGITTFEEEFLAHIVLPNGSTVGKWIGPQLARAYSTNAMPPLLGAGDEKPPSGSVVDGEFEEPGR